MAEEQVFRFMALRQAAEKRSKHPAKPRSRSYSVTGDDPPLAKEVLNLPVAARTPEVIKRLTQQFQSGNRYVQELTALPFDVAPLVIWLEEHALEPMQQLDLASFVKETYGTTPDKLVRSQPFTDSADRLAETLFADALGDSNHARKRDDIVHAIKLLHLVRACAVQPEVFKGNDLLSEFFARTTVVIPELKRPVPEVQEPTIKPDEHSRAEEARIKALRDRSESLAATHAELTRMLARPDALHAPPSEIEHTPADPCAANSRIALLEAQMAQMALRIERPETPAAATAVPAQPQNPAEAAGLIQDAPKITLSDRAAHALSQASKAVLAGLGIEPRTANPYTIVATLDAEMDHVAAQLPSPMAAHKVIALGGVTIDAAAFGLSYGFGSGKIDPGSLPPHQPCQFKAGVGDLLIVRQKLKAYELGDFAHVENVLMGEEREREHRRLSLREEITITESERETETQRDLQSTERNEMQNEASKTVQNQTKFDAGLQVSGSYGPFISFSATMNVGFSTSTQESQRKAVSYSREVTEKTSERMRERVREEQRRRVLEQTEEINVHRLKNTQNPTGHVRGIYRWLNKIYDAQVFNYGQRMMYEFTLPEPAAYFLYAMVENPPKDLEIEKPEAPMYAGKPLKPENLTRANYQEYLAQYEATNAKAPPSSYKHVSYTEKQEGKEENYFERTGKIPIPDGYQAQSARAWWKGVYYDTDYSMNVVVGGHGASNGWVNFNTAVRDEMSVGVFTFKVMSFVVTIDVYCGLSPAGFAKWQHETYATIMDAYLNKRAAYEEKVAALAIQKGPQILGRNPLENRRIERDELRKLVIMTLMKDSYFNINSFFAGAEPHMNITKSCQNGSKIRFFENAFEWHNMTYALYPYFWGRHARWNSAIHLTDPDPDFAAFLRAGAVRVQVPVRQGFEEAVAYFCQVGEIWEGNDVPLIGDKLYVPIVEEIAENLGKLDEGVPYPPNSKPWEVTVPTSLVVVQNLEEIPQIRDILTGLPINLMPTHG